MSIKQLEAYTAAHMTVPEYRADAVQQLVPAIDRLGDTGKEKIEGLMSAMSYYAQLSAHPAYQYLSPELRAQEIAAAQLLYDMLKGPVLNAARDRLLALDPNAQV